MHFLILYLEYMYMYKCNCIRSIRQLYKHYRYAMFPFLSGVRRNKNEPSFYSKFACSFLKYYMEAIILYLRGEISRRLCTLRQEVDAQRDSSRGRRLIWNACGGCFTHAVCELVRVSNSDRFIRTTLGQWQWSFRSVRGRESEMLE